MPDIKQPEPLKFVPERKTPRELSAERKKEVEREVDFLLSNPGAIAWGKKFPEKLKADLERLQAEVPGLKVGKPKKKKEDKKEKEEKGEKEEEPKKPSEPEEKEEKHKKSKK